MQALQIFTYAAVAVSVIAMVAKVIRYARAPEHMRWELYPVPHEKGRAEYGGSYFEELDWWTKPRETDMANEMKEMAGEILLLKGVYHHNRGVWFASFPFHGGLYLSIGWLFLLLAGGILQAAGMEVASGAGPIGALICTLTMVFGYPGLFLTGAGALGLFIWRATNEEQRRYSSFAEFFNLLFFMVVVALVLAASLAVDPQFIQLRAFVQSLVTLSPAAAAPSGLWTLAMTLTALLIMYVPLTRMSHFVAKYFLYHAVRWNDEPNERGARVEARLMELLNKKVGWSAPHMNTGKTWGEAVTTPSKEAGDE